MRFSRLKIRMPLAIMTFGALIFSLTIVTPAHSQDADTRSAFELEMQRKRDLANLVASEALLRTPLKPTIQDMFAQFKGRTPLEGRFRQLGPDSRIELIDKIAPEMIAQLEAAYPGATWAVLGRDAALFGDILEAFYLTLGQKDRVVRLNASTASFRRENQELSFLATAGLVDEKGRVKKKFVLLDPTSWNPQSQVRKLLAAVYSVNDDLWLPRLANVVALGPSHRGRNGEFLSAQLDIEEFRRRTEIDSNPKPAPARVMYLDGRLSYLHYGPGQREIAWHDSFREFERDINGRPVAKPGLAASEADRHHILWMMQMVIRIVQSNAFRQHVETIARSSYGYDFQANAARGDFAYLEDDEKMSRFLNQRKWTEAAIRDWIRHTTSSAAPGFRDLIAWRSLEMINAGLVAGALTAEQGTILLQDMIPRIAVSPEGMKFFFRLLKQSSASKRPSLLDAFMKCDWNEYSSTWWFFARELHQSGTGLARQFMTSRPFNPDEAEQTYLGARALGREDQARHLLSAAFQWAPDEESLTALTYRMERHYTGRGSALWMEIAPLLADMRKQHEAKRSVWQKTSRTIGSTCASALRILKK